MSEINNLKPVQKLRPFTHFCMTIGNLPSSYLESMTYYEQIVWFIKFLEDTVIPTINNNSEAVEELQQNVVNFENNITTLFNQLKSYVDNYFENLDVQEEINNKLDAMAEAGTLQEIITSYLQIKGLLAFNNINEMKSSPNLVNGSFAVTYGYSNLNDGGKSYYKIRTITNEDIFDETNLIALTNPNLVAELINPFEINPEHFAGINDTEKVQNAINYAVSLYNTEIPVIINLNRLFTITQSLAIETNYNRLPFVFSSKNGGGFFKSSSGLLFSTSKNYVSDIEFNNITFKSTDGSGLVIMNSPKFININFLNCCFKNVDKILFSETYIQSFNFNNCLITGGVGHCIEFSGSYFLNITNCVIEKRGTGGYFIYQNDDTTTQYNRQFHTNICNNLIEGFLTTNHGFIHIVRYELINICNNFIEGIEQVITHNCKTWEGTLNIKNNRLFQNSWTQSKATSGLLKMLPYEDTSIYRMGNINFEGNEIRNTYAIYFDSEYIDYDNDYSSYKNLYYKGNSVFSEFTSTFKFNGKNTNPHFNILPIFRNNNGSSKYKRQLWRFFDEIRWEEDIVVDEITYHVLYKIFNGTLSANILFSSYINNSITRTKLYFGFDIFLDDIYTVSAVEPNCNILSFTREGTANNKFLNISAESSSPGNKNLYATVIVNGYRG